VSQVSLTPELAARRPERWERARDEAEQLAAHLPPLLIAAERLATATALGVHGRRRAGMGETFWQFRRYQQEDAPSAIDWRQSAKSRHLFVREREWEAAESVWLWRDGSAGMHFTSSPQLPTKQERASVLALALTSLLIRGGERVAVLGADYPPTTGRVALRRVAHCLSEPKHNHDNLPPASVASRNSAVVWLSDFLAPFEQIEARMRALAHAGVHGFLVQVIDPAEEDFPFMGRVCFETPQHDDETTLGRAETVRAAYRTRFNAHVETLGELARRLNWSFTRHRTDRSPQTALIALYAALGGERARRGF
jgi:uncharacterized protein (DUF58 family)